MCDVVALGELLIDFTPQQPGLTGSPLFQQNPGGAPANVLAALAALGRQTAFIGKVGSDDFGHYLESVLKAQRIDTSGLVFSKDVNTTLAFVTLSDNGERSFTFYRRPGADMMFQVHEINYSLIDRANIFHFGSVSLTHEPVRSATHEAVSYAKKKGLLISYDPNVRMNLWDNAEEAKEQIVRCLPYADILKVSEEELTFLTGTDVLEDGTQQLYSLYGTPCILVTLGEQGCFYRTGEITGHVRGFRVKAVDTNGAGDAFLGGILFQVLQMSKPMNEWSRADTESMITFGNAMGAIVASKQGALPAMPGLSEVQRMLGNM
ncbi:PfkB family carbohydrate kinase [Paenibacillus hexagrammi]|uniref:PfkB family carbohydrate kinase n=1 Tax=Paenibacillus hexagrammi TaxID=2908839 RepID=A0ABY3SNS8_9BACL|nr:PfkB family carbohydrate kinase [Paenibacillus sp. YPD9-1]UJF34647.1 PfkB family carbohydrate kinase [Paenibacillus sp. YPD9-1]